MNANAEKKSSHSHAHRNRHIWTHEKTENHITSQRVNDGFFPFRKNRSEFPG